MVLKHLLDHGGEIVTRADLMRHLYGELEMPNDKIIDVFICKLRKKLAQAGAGSVIGTVWGRGFTAYPAFSGQERS